MAQFDVYRSPRAKVFPLVVDVQSELLSRLNSRVVIPLITLERYGARPITRLHPVAKIDGVEYVLVTHELAAVPANAIAKPIASLAHMRSTLLAALDLLITGA
jgi:toxin CcdB